MPGCTQYVRVASSNTTLDFVLALHFVTDSVRGSLMVRITYSRVSRAM